MQAQCERMLSISPCSYVFLYSTQVGVQVLPAISVAGARHCNPHELTSQAIKPFFFDHFECFIGDRGLAITKARGVQGLLEELGVRKRLELEGEED